MGVLSKERFQHCPSRLSLAFPSPFQLITASPCRSFQIVIEKVLQNTDLETAPYAIATCSMLEERHAQLCQRAVLALAV